MAEMIANNEIRIFVYRGLIQHIGMGTAIPKDLSISVAEGAVDETDQAELEDNGFGQQCVFSVWKGRDSNCHTDENGIRWV